MAKPWCPYKENLSRKTVEIPSDFQPLLTLLLARYKQDSQFDIDRWLIAFNMTETEASTHEIPAIQDMFPRMFEA